MMTERIIDDETQSVLTYLRRSNRDRLKQEAADIIERQHKKIIDLEMENSHLASLCIRITQ